MAQYEDWKRAEGLALKKAVAAELECVVCNTCGSTWFEQVEAFQFKAEHNLIVGQQIPTRVPGGIPFILMRCLQCQGLLEPRIIHNTRDFTENTYDDLLDTVEGKKDKRKKVEAAKQEPKK